MERRARTTTPQLVGVALAGFAGSAALSALHLPYDLGKPSTMSLLGEFAERVEPGAGKAWAKSPMDDFKPGPRWLAERPPPDFRLDSVGQGKRGEEAVYTVWIRGEPRKVTLVRR
jgi:hypothetical protein